MAIKNIGNWKNHIKRLLQKKKRRYQIELTADVETLNFITPQDYWQFWKREKQYPSTPECLDIENFKHYYMSQNKSARNPNFDHVLMEKIDTLINSNEDMFATLHDAPLCDILNSPISADDVSLALRKGKNNKAAGINGIPVEFYKYGGDELVNTMLALFNYLLEKGCYPDEWCEVS